MQRYLMSIALVAGLVQASFAATSLTTEQRLQRVERRVGHISGLTLKLEALQRENRELRGQIETLEHQISQLKRKQRDIYQDMDQRLSQLQSGSAGAAEPAMASDSVPGNVAAGDAATAAAPVDDRSNAPSSAVNAASVDPQMVRREYQAAYDMLSPQQRRYPDAIKAFTAFLQKYPQDALAPNAQYWLGEAYYVSADNTRALAAFEQLVSLYPESTKVPGALYKIGRIQHVMGQTAAARKSLQRVIQEYPGSPAVGLARQRLELIQRESR